MERFASKQHLVFDKQIRFIAFRFLLITTYNNRQDGAQDKLAHCRTSSEHRGPGAEAEEDEIEKKWKKVETEGGRAHHVLFSLEKYQHQHLYVHKVKMYYVSSSLVT